MKWLAELDPENPLSTRKRPESDPATEKTVREIIDSVMREGEPAVLRYAGLYAEKTEHGLYLDKSAMDKAAESLEPEVRDLLERGAARVTAFARTQLAAISPMETDIPGGKAGHAVAPVERAGCYAPGGRYPLPSSAIMTAATARAAGVADIWVASPNPGPVMLAAAGLAGADGFLASGGAQAIAAFARGMGPMAPRDFIAGPGNRYVTAAKRLLSGTVGIDMLAGPSELVVVADDTSDPLTVAADLLAQAEHDPDSVPILIALSESIALRVDSCLGTALESLPTSETAKAALRNGGVFLAGDLAAGARIADVLAPEHLELAFEGAKSRAGMFRAYGGLFIGEKSAEVFGDYCAGPNHVLPTGGSARFSGGLSVFSFLRIRTWMELEQPAEMSRDAAALARLEGLEAHARAAERRNPAIGAE